jgi:putative phosphoesterase
MRIGVISDTHGLLRREAIAALARSDLIIHAGDVGSREVLDQLRDIAPTQAVRGNIDTQSWARTLPDTALLRADRQHLFVLHDISQLSVDPVYEGYDVIVFGHSHRASAKRRKGILFLNPGSAGPRRFGLPVTIAKLQVAGRNLRARIITLL